MGSSEGPYQEVMGRNETMLRHYVAPTLLTLYIKVQGTILVRVSHRKELR